MTFLLYGANGYTGNLIARFAKDFGLTPILAGRTESKIKPLAEELGYEYRIFNLDDTSATEAALADIEVVLHAAGPFMFTAEPMIQACLKTKTHYLDITGEYQIFEAGAAKNDLAKKAGIMLMSGVGFDVVPTDCMAAYLKQEMPNATHLRLAFGMSGGGVSHGTALTMSENLGQPSKVRKNGKLVNVPMGHKTMKVPFARKPLFCMTIPWGDISTAYWTTEIPNIETYTAVPPSQYKFVKYGKYFNWLLRTSFVKKIVQKRINDAPAGPSDKSRSKAFSQVWGEVTDAAGNKKSANLVCKEGYTLTAEAALLITKKVLQGEVKSGYQTPAGLYGADLILEIEGSERTDL